MRLIQLTFTLFLTFTCLCADELGDQLQPLKRPTLASAKIVLKNLKLFESTAQNENKDLAVELAASIKKLFTCEHHIQVALKEQIAAEVTALNHEQSARDWMKPTAFKPDGNPKNAEHSLGKAATARNTAVKKVASTRQKLKTEMRNMDALIVSLYETQKIVPTVILASTMEALNSRSMGTDSFEMTVSSYAIDKLKVFIQNVNIWLQDAKSAESATNYEKAFRLYTKAKDKGGRKRNSLALAKKLEEQKLYGSACDYYEIADDFANATRLRKEHPKLLHDSFAKLNAEDLYAKVDPCCVRVLASSSNSKGLGTGFFFKRGGYILTNNHVIDGANELEVITSEGKKYLAQVIAKSKTPDLAVLKIDIPNHEVIKLGATESVKIGTSVALVGYPIKNLATATMNAGIVSNTNRIFDDNPCFQLDMTANHGNSGGPVMTKDGRVIGILTFGLGDTNIDRFNFAIRVDVIRQFLLKKLGRDFSEN